MTAKPATATRAMIAMATSIMVIDAGAGALMRSMVRRRATRLPTGASAEPTAGARSAMPEASATVRVAANATAIGKRSEPEHERRAKRARG